MSKETILKEFDEKSISDFYKKEKNNYNDEYRKAFNISKSFKVVKYPREVDFKIIRNFISKSIDQTREETIMEAIRKIEKIKIAVAKQTGAFKYDSCYEDCIDILNKLKK